MKEMLVKIPIKEWDGFLRALQRINFRAKRPVTTRHKKYNSKEYICFSFFSDYNSDFDFVFTILPKFSQICVAEKEYGKTYITAVYTK